MHISTCLVWFFLYSIVGWLWESIYCTCVERSWQNRGFLYGPLCPIYGISVTIMILGYRALVAHGVKPETWQVFVGSALLCSGVELLTSVVLERLFHARWWDYANLPFNFQGRICLPAALFFGAGGVLITQVLLLPTIALTNALAPGGCELVALLGTALVSADTAITVSGLTRFAQAAAQLNQSANAHMEQLVEGMVGYGESVASNVRSTSEAMASNVRTTGETVVGAARQARDSARLSIADAAAVAYTMGASARLAAQRVKSYVPSGLPAGATDALNRLKESLDERR